MTNFEIAMLIVLIAYDVIFCIIYAGLFSRTRRNKLDIEITNTILDAHKSRIDAIVDKMDSLVQIISDQTKIIHELPKKEKDHIVIDFDCADAVFSRSGGVHLHYICDGTIQSLLDKVVNEEVENADKV